MHIGSITKLLNATLVMQLVDEGRVDLTALLKRYLPDFQVADTIHVEGIGSVRLIGIDTPESVDPRKPVQFFAKQASAFTSRMVQGKSFA